MKLFISSSGSRTRSRSRSHWTCRAIRSRKVASPRTLNYCLRYLIIMFTSTYPFVSIASIFWLSIPPYLCITGAFPFALD